MFAAVALALALQATPSGSVAPLSPEHNAVTAPVNAVFDALAARSAEGLEAHFDPAAQLTVVHERADGPNHVTHLTWQQFAGGLQPGPEKLEEVMFNPTVAVDGDVAVVWGEYVFRIDGRLSHCGVDHFSLVRQAGVWKITSLTWNQRTHGCEALDAATASN
jgi:hypothetical protein